MTVHSSTATPPPHPAAIQDVYGRMLRSANLQGRFVRRRSGERVHVIEAGRGEPVVHLHGTNTSALSHLMLAERTRSTHSYLVDRPGCGLSDPTEFTPGQFHDHAVAFVDEVLDALALDAASWSAPPEAGSGRRGTPWPEPERVAGLVMLGSVPAFPAYTSPPLRLMVTPVIGDLLARGVKPGRRTLLRLMASMGEETAITNASRPARLARRGARDPVAVAANRAELRALMSPFGWRTSMRITPQELRRLAVPTLMIWGDRDPVVPLAGRASRIGTDPRARLEVLPAGHVPQLGNPDAVAGLIERFAMSQA